MTSLGEQLSSLDAENDRLINERREQDAELRWEPCQTGPTWVTENKGHKLSVAEIEYVQDLPEYPNTSEGGYGYVVPAAGRSAEQIRALVESTIRISQVSAR
ncbi:uncharacterized protein N7458_003647 [Penicillium daleae]|uniref:Uncharacterized protein n=1 Tax=Penicillium daleae TaxID=63821 RepID=A0AAD6CI01_9EURO|nr:uncharacterized protein N7458_003647 [Penicillium daleae]KAJ5462095.1 hypothetical protein N7458_003647 [Penicillium daleae]